ncbi:MAG: hypothetical protein C0485_10390 [Pirellula sp.]|nr:hypothetical protein [Pirellula sp.]
MYGSYGLKERPSRVRIGRPGHKESVVSSCFNGDWHGRQLGIVAALLAVLACGSANAQSVSDNLPFESSASGRVYNGTTPLRLWHQTRGYGMEASQTAFGGRLAVDLVDAIGFMDGQFRVSNESQFGLDFGGGFRWMAPSLLTGDTRVYGLTGWYDGQETNLNNYFNQIGVSFESLGEQIDFRANANIPLENEKSGDIVIDTGEVTYFQNFLSIGTLIPSDVSLRIVDFEVAPRIFDLNAWVYAGGYQMDGNDVSDMGAKGGVRGYVTNDLAVDLGVQNDDTFGTNTVFQIIWTPGRTGAGPTSWIHTLADRMREQVYRNTYVATTQVNRTGADNLTNVDGQDIRVVHVDFTSSAPGDGTFENPYTSIDSVNDDGSQQGDIILVHAQNGANIYNGQSVTLKDEQRFLGEGGGIQHTVVTQQLGEIDLPETFAGALNATRPTMQNASGSAVTLAGITDESDGFSGMEVSNFVITGGTNAVISDTNGVATVDINNLNISNTAGGAIELAAMTQTLANNTTRSRFAVTIDEITFDNVGTVDADDDIQLDAGTTETTISHTTAISNIVSTNGEGVGINLIENQRAVTINNYDWNGGTTGLGALLITEAGTQGGVTLSNSDANDDNLFQGGTVGAAYAINIQNSAGTHTVTGTEILNTGGDSIVVNDGAANLNFTGQITRDVANVNSILSVTGGHTGALTFTELTANEGVIIATSGDGLQFNDADGVYTFNDLVDFTGTSAAVNVQGDSAAVLTFQDIEVTDTTGTAFTFNGGDANMTLTGRIVQATAQTVLNVTNGHAGTLVFNEKTANQGVISATNGNGLQFDNADGAYTFNDQVKLAGATPVISVNSSADTATFNFAEVDIDYTGASPGAAVTISNSDLQTFTISGDIDVTGGAGGRPVLINNNTGGSITFNTTISSDQQGILVTGNTDTTIRFAGQTQLTTTTNDAVTLTSNTNGGVRFDNLQITTTTGDGFVATASDNVTVQGTANTITTTTGTALSLNNVEVGSAGVQFATVSSNGAVNGVALNDVTGGAVTINGGTIQGSTGAGIVMTNSSNLALNGVVISGGDFEGIDYNLTTDMTSRLALTGVNISNTQLEGVSADINTASGAATANIRIVNSTISNASDDESIFLTTSGAGSKTVNLLVQGSNVSNNSATAPAANFQAGSSTTLNATVLNNQFTNTNVAPGRPFEMAANNGAIVRLNLNGNTGNATSGAAFFLEENSGAFSVVDIADVATDNTGIINFTPNQAAFGDDPGGIPTPP